jgi:hypothetical protein
MRDDAPGAVAVTIKNVVRCAVEGCETKGPVRYFRDLSTGNMVPEPPDGWGIIEAVVWDGTENIEHTFFVCSRACERRLVMGLSDLKLGTLD